MSQTVNCIICAQYGKRRRATNWFGCVLFINDDEKDVMLAGFCDEHEKDSMTLKRPRHLPKHCFAVWLPDMGRSNPR